MINPLHAFDHAKPFGRGVPVETSALDTVREALQRIGPRRLLLGLDLAAVGVIGAAFAQIGPPELLFHVAFVILTVEAFNFGRRICLQR